MEERSGQGLLARLRAAPPWVWISILLAAGVLIVSWLIYRQKQAGASGSLSDLSAGSVPANGSGQPVWPSSDATAGSNFGELQALLQYIASTKTPNPTPTASPKTQTKSITLASDASLNDIAKQYGVSEGWLASWNRQLSNANWFTHPWWKIPKGTKVNIPYSVA